MANQYRTLAIAGTILACLSIAPSTLAQDAADEPPANTPKRFDVLTMVQGIWAIDPETVGGLPDDNPFRCGVRMERITIDPDAMRYQSEFFSTISDPDPIVPGDADAVWSADILHVANDFGDGPAMIIQYDQETRLDPDGDPLGWFLVMTDINHFRWYPMDLDKMRITSMTTGRERCPPENLTS